jgi:hypothetical protein
MDQLLCKWCGEPIGDHDIAPAVYPQTLQGVRYDCPLMPDRYRAAPETVAPRFKGKP